MGLLDDAIREHLELKRRRGADPGEVAREQREALDPAGGGPGTDPGAEQPISGNAASPGSLAGPARSETGEAAHPGELGGAAGQQGSPGTVAAMDETAELDMRAVLDADARAAEAQAAPGVAQAAAGTSRADEEALDWETPGQTAGHDLDADAPDEDVLEETPEFLRDTPEQERLWFEQRPPRNFDFDK
jgi:hypothetical protein